MSRSSPIHFKYYYFSCITFVGHQFVFDLSMALYDRKQLLFPFPKQTMLFTLFRHFLESHEKITLPEVGLQTPVHTSAYICICTHIAMWHSGPTESNVTKGNFKQGDFKLVLEELLFFHSLICLFFSLVPRCKCKSMSIYRRPSQYTVYYRHSYHICKLIK